MHFYRSLLLSILLCSLSHLAATKIPEVQLLHSAINALNDGLQYMEDNVSEINLDGAFGCRLVEEIFHAFLVSRPDVFQEVGYDMRNQLELLATKADRIAENARPYLKINEPQYYTSLSSLLDKSKVLMWFPSRTTKPSLQVRPLPCSQSVFNESLSDQCLQGLLGLRSKHIESCTISDACLKLMTGPRQRAYVLTHQVLYFQLLEANNCLMTSQVKSIPQHFQDTLCSNVMRDAEEIANSGYPMGHRDLFMEQIGLCGLWGYRDFYKPEWLTSIIQWQQKSGCYANLAPWMCTENLSELKVRVKRQEKILEDGCLAHKTTVALLAIAANIRFIAEVISGLQ